MTRTMLAQDQPQSLDDHVATLRRYARALTAQPAEADALVQECLKRALESVPSWRGIKDERMFLFSVMHAVYAEFAGRGAGAAGKGIETARRRGQPLPQDMGAVHAALQKLPDEQRETLLLLSFNGMTYDEVSDVMNVSVATVMSRLCRGRESLRHYMRAGANDVADINAGTSPL